MNSPLPRRKRLGLKNELLLALLPTLTILGVLAFIEVLSRQRLLFASLASSAFLIYLDPEHGVNKVRTLLFSQISAATIGALAFALCGPGYLSAGTAMVLAIVVMIVSDTMHPPAMATALSFGLKAGNENNLVLFVLAASVAAVLVVMQRGALWLVRRAVRKGN